MSTAIPKARHVHGRGTAVVPIGRVRQHLHDGRNVDAEEAIADHPAAGTTWSFLLGYVRIGFIRSSL